MGAPRRNPAVIALGWKLSYVPHEWSQTEAVGQTGAGCTIRARAGPGAKGAFLKQGSALRGLLTGRKWTLQKTTLYFLVWLGGKGSRASKVTRQTCHYLLIGCRYVQLCQPPVSKCRSNCQTNWIIYESWLCYPMGTFLVLFGFLCTRASTTDIWKWSDLICLLHTRPLWCRSLTLNLMLLSCVPCFDWHFEMRFCPDIF